MEVSVARYLRTPPEGANPQGLIRDYRAALSSETCLSIVVVGNYKISPITVAQCRVQRTVFQRPSIPFHPHHQLRTPSELVVEVAVSKPRPEHLLHSRFSTIAALRRHIEHSADRTLLQAGIASARNYPAPTVASAGRRHAEFQTFHAGLEFWQSTGLRIRRCPRWPPPSLQPAQACAAGRPR